MSRRCATPQCDGPGVINVSQGRYACERCADKLRTELAEAKAMSEPISIAERDAHAAQVANSHSLTDIYPELRDPAVLAQQIGFWREIERNR